MKREHINEIQGIIVLAIGLILLASFISFVPEDLSWYTSVPNVPAKNLIRVVGAYTAGFCFFLLGYSSYFLVIFFLFWSWNKFSSRELQFTWTKIISALVLFAVVSSLFSITGPSAETFRFERGGIIGFLWADFLVKYLGRTGAYIILLMLGSLTMVVTGEFLVSPILFAAVEWFHQMFEGIREKIQEMKEQQAKNQVISKPRYLPPKRQKDIPAILKDKFAFKKEPSPQDQEKISGASCEETVDKPDPAAPSKPRIRIAPKDAAPSAAVSPAVKDNEPKRVDTYQLPPMDLLDTSPDVATSKIQSDLEEGAQTLEQTLLSFGVSAHVADIERGPVITRYELEPGPGVKVQRITTLADDIALAMRAHSVRIVAPIPGKNRVGIEVPNSLTAAVYLKDVLQRSKFQSAKSKLMLALGKDISGHPLIADLAEMPHLLIAGTTGSGKTVCVNSIIMSMVFNATPREVKFLMVDPKMVELACYNDLPHMLCPAVTDHKRVAAALNWVVGEMESRYNTLSKAQVRNIKSYHDLGQEMPYIVVIIDELADLMQVAAKTIESAITRLAQLSRAVGIHLILATQRPSVDVITGVIKANFPARVSFKVASKVDSRTVLDMNGAETLLGKGDLLFMKPGEAKPTRGQGSFVSDKEVFRVIEFIKNQQQPAYDDAILTQQKSGSAGGMEEKDELYDEAVKLVIETNQASVSILQRRMRLGYTRAARLIDMMEQNGLVGPYCGSKPREILVDREGWLMDNMNKKEEGSEG